MEKDSKSSVEVIAAPGVPVSHLPFSPALRVGDLVFVSGQASVDASGKIVNDTFENEFRRSIENVRLVLKGAGLDLKHIVQLRSYVDDPADLPAYNTLYREYFSEPFPARTTLLRCLGGMIKYEVDVIAYAGK